MRTYITIDGGTTSTRVRLVKNREILETVQLPLGVLAASENGEAYRSAIKGAIDEIIAHSMETPERILASGMITSEFGLCHLPHIQTPAGILELHETMHEVVLEDIAEIPFVFIRGVCTPSENFEDFDMMRGEETELTGLFYKEYGECIYVLPGSHSKCIQTDERGRILSFSTMLTGEMIAALAKGTILKDAVNLKTDTIDRTYLLKGYRYAEEVGLNKALFKVRILKNIFGCTEEEVYSFFMGVVLRDEILTIAKAKEKTVVLGGKSQIKNAMAVLLQETTDKKVVALSEACVEHSTSLGMIRVYEKDV